MLYDSGFWEEMGRTWCTCVAKFLFLFCRRRVLSELPLFDFSCNSRFHWSATAVIGRKKRNRDTKSLWNGKESPRKVSKKPLKMMKRMSENWSEFTKYTRNERRTTGKRRVTGNHDDCSSGRMRSFLGHGHRARCDVAFLAVSRECVSVGKCVAKQCTQVQFNYFSGERINIRLHHTSLIKCNKILEMCWMLKNLRLERYHFLRKKNSCRFIDLASGWIRN